jgi:hypothetical protein
MPYVRPLRETRYVAASASVAPLSRGRKITVWTLVVLATLLAFVSILTTWVNRQMFDNTAWNKATTQVVQDPQVQSALATYLVNELYANVNVAQEFENHLPSTLKPLAAPLAGALEQSLPSGVKRVLAQQRIQQLFINASTIAHQKLVNVLENKTGHGLSTANGVVTLDLHTLAVDVGTQLGIPSDALAKLPDTAGTITLMKSDQLSAAQTGVRAVHALSAWLLVGVLFLYGLAIYLARGARRVTLRNAGLGLVIVGLVTLLVRTLGGDYVTNALASPGYEPATHRLWLIGTAMLGQIGAAVLLYGLITAAGAVYAGPTPIAVRVRRSVAPTMNEHQGIIWGAVGFVYLLAILWGGTHALRTWWGVLLLAALIAIGVAALRAQSLREFPTGPQLAPAGAPPEGLAHLDELHDAGAIGDAAPESASKPNAPPG